MLEAKYANVAGLKTRYLESGSAGEPMLLMHGGHFGLVASANVWAPVVDKFAKNFHVYAIDRPGQGFTDNPKKDSDYVIGITVKHAYEFLKVMGIQKAHVVGHSRGGYSACRLALEHPEVVKTLTLVDSGTLIGKESSGGTRGRSKWYEEMFKEADKIKDPRERYRFLAAHNSYGNSHITDEYVDIMLQIEALPKTKEASDKMEGLHNQFHEDLAARKEETHKWIVSGKLKAPTLIVWAFNDPSAKLEPGGLDTMRLIFPNVPKAQMHIINQAGHRCFAEQPDAFVAAVTSFIKQADGKA